MENTIDPKYQNLSRKERIAIARQNLRYIDIGELEGDIEENIEEIYSEIGESVKGLGLVPGEDILPWETPFGIEFVFIDDLKELGIEIEDEEPRKPKKNKKKNKRK